MTSTDFVPALQWWTLCLAGTAAVMPIGVAILAASFQRRQSLRELRSRELVRVYEDLLGSITVFGIAAFRGEQVFEHWLSLQAKFAVARIHSGTEIVQYLEDFEKMSVKIFEAAWAVREGITSPEEAAQHERRVIEESGKMMACLEILADAVQNQLGPVYTESSSRWNDWRISLGYTFLKAKERLMIKRSEKPKGQWPGVGRANRRSQDRENHSVDPREPES